MALEKQIVVLVGGVGGAKLAAGLLQTTPPGRLTFIVNTGDDFWRLGLKICPDLDTLMYTLSGLVNKETGWGINDDSLVALGSLEKHYGVTPWFRLGDKDLATHLLRTHGLRSGQSLTEVTDCLAGRLGIKAKLLPMCDEDLPTIIDTEEHGEVAFQEYFVKQRWAPTVKSIRHQGNEAARLPETARRALENADLVLIAPSNPWLSLAPILAVPGMRKLLASLRAPVVAMTPIIAGAAVKGPTAKIMRELGLQVSAKAVAQFYGGIIDGFVNDSRNAPLRIPNLRSIQLDTLMQDEQDKARLARATLDWIEGWAP